MRPLVKVAWLMNYFQGSFRVKDSYNAFCILEVYTFFSGIDALQAVFFFIASH